MRTARANRLARRAFGGGPRARHAWRTLSAAAQRHDHLPVNHVVRAVFFVLTGRQLTEDEADHVVTRLAGEQDWDQLWRLVPTIPLTAAARAATLCGDWQPEAGRHLFTCLADVALGTWVAGGADDIALGGG